MPNRERRKGIEYEREVATMWRNYGFDVQDLQHNVGGLADQLIVGHGVALLSDPKRRETLRVPEWIRQMEDAAFAFADTIDTPFLDGWLIPFRQSGSRWRGPKSYVVAPHDELVRMLAR